MTPKTVRFGVYEVDLANAELRKHGLRVRIQEQPFQILASLLERPGEVIAREDLVKRLWPDGTFVDFERGLNAAVTRLRQALSDSADDPRYVETVARRGYRFIAPLEPALEAARPASPKTQLLHKSGPAQLVFAIVFLFAVAGAIWLLTRKQAPSDSAVRPIPLTTYSGFESSPSFSPDGNQVAFAWDQGKGVPQIYIKLIGQGEPLRLTSGADAEYGPAWSPDGRHIAFVRLDSTKAAVFVVPALGGVERKVVEFNLPYLTTYVPHSPTVLYRWVGWTPDSKHLVVSGADSSGGGHGLFLLSLDTGDRRRITNLPTAQDVSDRSPSVSQDGKNVAFCRMTTALVGEVYTVSLSLPLNEPRKLTSDRRSCANPTWTPDGREIVFQSNRDGDMGIWRLDRNGGSAARRLAGLGTEVYDPAVSHRGKLAYARYMIDSNIWRQPLRSRAEAVEPPVNLIASTAADHNPQYSPVDARITFQSWRSGNSEIWLCSGQGTHCVQLTNMNGPHTGSPRWSPDGKQIAFDSAAAGNFDIYIVEANGGTPRRVTNDPSGDVVPSWSADGKWIYFSSSRTGQSQVWKVPATGGTPVQVTRNGGFTAFESPNGRALYYTKDNYLSKLWRAQLDGTSEVEVVDGILARGFAVGTDRLYYLHQEPGRATGLRCRMLETGKDSLIALIPKPIHVGLSLSPDGQSIVYSQVDQGGSDLMLVDGFK